MVNKIKALLKRIDGVAPQEEKSNLPLLIVPTKKEGLHAHSGDSFRELAEMWFENGFVDLRRSQTANFCWLRGEGDILLYDRPTYKWLDETPFEMALVGNPAPNYDKPMRDWTFWPRNPRLVEVLAHTNNNGYEERPKRCVFYGKVENEVQKGNRAEEWLTACDDYHLASQTESYKLGPEEYLNALANSKFGLCLAGYGNKCHREIECMAMGTVPLCAKEVDMDGYANSLKEGTHYFRVSSPTEARIISETTDKDEWKRMSIACKEWWRSNASCEGSWNLTKRLCGL
jgi:hypothetical protein